MKTFILVVIITQMVAGEPMYTIRRDGEYMRFQTEESCLQYRRLYVAFQAARLYRKQYITVGCVEVPR